MDFEAAFQRFVDLQSYVGWSDDERRWIVAARELIAPHVPALIDDFYTEINRHPATRQVITGGPAQIARLKQPLRDWLFQLFDEPHSR